MEKPTKAFMPELLDAKTSEEKKKIMETAATVYTNLIVEQVQSFPEEDLPVVLLALGSVKETFEELYPTADTLSKEMSKGLKRLVFVSE